MEKQRFIDISGPPKVGDLVRSVGPPNHPYPEPIVGLVIRTEGTRCTIHVAGWPRPWEAQRTILEII